MPDVMGSDTDGIRHWWDPTRPTRRDATRRDATRRDATRRDATQRNAMQCNAMQCNAKPTQSQRKANAKPTQSQRKANAKPTQSQRNATQRNATQRNATQRNATQRNATQRNATQRNATQRNATQTKTNVDRHGTFRDTANWQIHQFDRHGMFTDTASLQARYVYAITLAPPVCAIFNSSLKEGIVPQLWKYADIRPLSKVQPPKLIHKDLRPISITPVLSKCLVHFILRLDNGRRRRPSWPTTIWVSQGNVHCGCTYRTSAQFESCARFQRYQHPRTTRRLQQSFWQSWPSYFAD